MTLIFFWNWLKFHEWNKNKYSPTIYTRNIANSINKCYNYGCSKYGNFDYLYHFQTNSMKLVLINSNAFSRFFEFLNRFHSTVLKRKNSCTKILQMPNRGYVHLFLVVCQTFSCQFVCGKSQTNKNWLLFWRLVRSCLGYFQRTCIFLQSVKHFENCNGCDREQ